MSWGKVGEWVKQNAGTGAKLVGGLLTGNVPQAVAAGVSLVTGATGEADPDAVLHALQNDPAAAVKLRELYYQNEASVRGHIEAMERLRLEDEQAAHETTQKTVRQGDVAEDAFVRRTRPAQSWLSLIAAFVYVFAVAPVDIVVLTALLTLPWAYAGLRQVGKGVDSVTSAVKARKS